MAADAWATAPSCPLLTCGPCCRVADLPSIIAPPSNQGTLPANTQNVAFLKSVDTDGTLNHTVSLIPSCNYTLEFQYCNVGGCPPCHG